MRVLGSEPGSSERTRAFNHEPSLYPYIFSETRDALVSETRVSRERDPHHLTNQILESFASFLRYYGMLFLVMNKD